jgi:hypothetical protein
VVHSAARAIVSIVKPRRRAARKRNDQLSQIVPERVLSAFERVDGVDGSLQRASIQGYMNVKVGGPTQMCHTAAAVPEIVRTCKNPLNRLRDAAITYRTVLSF